MKGFLKLEIIDKIKFFTCPSDRPKLFYAYCGQYNTLCRHNPVPNPSPVVGAVH